MSYVRGNCGRKTPYEKKYSRKNKEQEEWALEKSAFDARSEQVSDVNTILEQFEARSEEGRRCALRNLIRTARNFDSKQMNALEENKKLLIQFLCPSVRASPEEAQLAFEAIEILSVVYGNDDEFFAGLLDSVKQIALQAEPQKLEEEEQVVVGAAMRTLGALCFFCCEDDDAILDVIRNIDNVITTEPKNVSQPVLAAALGAWELIHTVTEFSDAYFERIIASVWKHLKSGKSSVDTRIAAARAIAFFFDHVGGEDDGIEKLRQWIPDIDRLKDIINECAYGTTHPKSDRAKEQPLFKMLAEWMIEGNGLPDETVTINGVKVTFESWITLTRLATVRRIVASGFLPHISNNPVLALVLEFEAPELETRRRMLRAQKHYARRCAREADKARTIARSREDRNSSFDEE